MPLLRVVLPQQIFAIVIPIRRLDHDMNGLRLLEVSHEAAQRDRPLVVEFDEQHRAV